MNNIVNVTDAKLNTLQVEVNTIIISGKQMTLSVFRQIPYKQLFLRTTRECGDPILVYHEGYKIWGFVNYHWIGCDPKWERRKCEGSTHVVWQLGEKLYRSLEYLPALETPNNKKFADQVRASRQLFIAV